MAIATALAVAGAAAAAKIGGNALAASAQKKAANKAADVSLQTAQENNALARDIYSQNQGFLSPYVYRGNAAGDTLNALLGLGNIQPRAGQTPGFGDGTYAGGPVDWAGYVRGNSDALANWDTIRGTQSDTFGGDISRFGAFHYNSDGARRDLTPYTAQTSSPASSVDPTQAAQNAFDIFRNSTGYQFRLGEGLNALNTGLASRGLLQSGAAIKEAEKYGQNFASNEFGNYLGYLGNQQGVGLGGASALAGVGQNYVNTISNNNNSAGSAAANAALIKGNANANMYGGIANALGKFASSFGG